MHMTDVESAAPAEDAGLTEAQAVEQLMARGKEPAKAEPTEPAPEAEGDEATAAAAVEEPEAGDEAEPETAEQEDQPRFTVRVDGKELEVDQAELIRGYQRLSDYTRKTQALASERDQIASTKAEVERERAQLKAEREAFAAFASDLSKDPQRLAPPEWEKLAENDPMEYMRQHALWQSGRHPAQLAQAEMQRAAQAEFDRQKAKLLELFPDWRDGEKAKAGKAELIAELQHRGFNDAEINGIGDARVFPIVRDAALWRRHQAEAAKAKTLAASRVTAPAATALKPGKVTDKAEREAAGRTALLQRARTSGKSDDAVRALAGLI
jgi:hypothetical protein